MRHHQRSRKTSSHSLLVAGAACALVMLLTAAVDAATYTITAAGDGRTYTIVDADTFTATTGPGNTVRAVSPGAPWSSTTNTSADGLWTDRAHSAFFGFTVPGSAGNLYELSGADRTNAPEIVTTVSGLTPGQYDVFVAYVIRDDTSSDKAAISANMGAPASTVHSHNTPFVIPGLNGTGTWDVALSPLGTTSVGATGFAANIAGTTTTGRNDYIGLAFIPTAAPTADLQVDFGNSKGTGGGPGGIQSGFVGFEFFENAGTPANTRTFHSSIGQSGTVDVTIEGYTHFRDYGAITGGSFTGDSDLLSDLVLRTSTGTMKLTLDDLADGRHEITTYHHGSNCCGSTTFDTDLTDGHGATSVSSGFVSSTGQSPSAIASQTFQFYADGSTPIEIDFTKTASGGHLQLNGFQVQAGGPEFNSTAGNSTTSANLFEVGVADLVLGPMTVTSMLTISNDSTNPAGNDPNLNTLSIDFDALIWSGSDAGKFSLLSPPTGVVTLDPGDTLDLTLQYTALTSDGLGIFNDAFLTLPTDQDAVFGDFANGTSFVFQLQGVNTPEPASAAIWVLLSSLAFAYVAFRRRKS